MQNTIGSTLVQIAALRVDALRRLIALAPPGDACGPLHAQLAEAEQLLRYRLRKFSELPHATGRVAEPPPGHPPVGKQAATS